jgi:hypothetical protein
MSLHLLHFLHFLYVLPSPSKQFLPPEIEILLSRLKTFPNIYWHDKSFMYSSSKKIPSWRHSYGTDKAVIWIEPAEMASWDLAKDVFLLQFFW